MPISPPRLLQALFLIHSEATEEHAVGEFLFSTITRSLVRRSLAV